MLAETVQSCSCGLLILEPNWTIAKTLVTTVRKLSANVVYIGIFKQNPPPSESNSLRTGIGLACHATFRCVTPKDLRKEKRREILLWVGPALLNTKLAWKSRTTYVNCRIYRKIHCLYTLSKTDNGTVRTAHQHVTLIATFRNG